MIRLVIALAIALALSLGVNVWQWRASIIDAQEQLADVRVAKEQGRADALGESLNRASLVAALATGDSAWLLAELGTIVDRGRERVTVYRDRIVAAPALPAACAPGEIRVDAVNELLGHGQ